MVMFDPLADALCSINNAEKVGKSECIIAPASKMVGNVLKIMQKAGYVGEYEFVDDGKSGKYKIRLLGKINSCNVIKPRYAVKYNAFERYEKRFLPGQNIGLLVVSTPKGVMSQNDAYESKVGGRLLAYVY